MHSKFYEREIKLICAWCGKIMREGEDPPSHGICEPCKEKFLEKIKRAPENGSPKT